MLKENNVPEGVLNLVAAESKVLGDTMFSDRNIPLVSFTGSTRIGQKVGRLVGERLRITSYNVCYTKLLRVAVKSQSPIMNHISLFYDENGKVDIDRSAQNWIDLGNVLAMLGIGFHSMYCARPTGEHHYFTAPLADISKIFNKVYRSLASINRPSRYITMRNNFV